MAIVNLTPDSFFAESRTSSPEAALAFAEHALAAGADMLDLGAESTRPGAVAVSAEEEWARLGPALERLRRALPEALLSVDTRHASTARRAIDAGADILNDVTGFEDDNLLSAAAAAQCGMVGLHHRGAFATMHQLPPLADPTAEVLAGLTAIRDRLETAGVHRERVVLDPGFGFGKNLDQNIPLLRDLDAFHQLGRPLLVGLSRKSFLRNSPEQPPADRLAASLAALTVAVLAGAHIVRVHDVAASVDARGLADRLLTSPNVRK